jgi:hypothetical protein
MTRGVIDSECRSISNEGLCARRRESRDFTDVGL